VQTSEDLHIRVFDTRVKPFTPQQALQVDTNFATTCDIFQGNLLATGHRGFNAAGSEVKLWDLRKFEQPTSIFTNHAFTPESVRFLDNEKPIVVSAGKDSCLNVIDGEGNQLQ
jgi:WD40 repeat protein